MAGRAFGHRGLRRARWRRAASRESGTPSILSGRMGAAGAGSATIFEQLRKISVGTQFDDIVRRTNAANNIFLRPLAGQRTGWTAAAANDRHGRRRRQATPITGGARATTTLAGMAPRPTSILRVPPGGRARRTPTASPTFANSASDKLQLDNTNAMTALRARSGQLRLGRWRASFAGAEAVAGARRRRTTAWSYNSSDRAALLRRRRAAARD
jgi:hypothetical protein